MAFAPWFKKDKEASVSAPAEPIMRKPDDGSEYDPMHSAFADLKQALDEGNHKAGAEALRSAIDLHLASQETDEE